MVELVEKIISMDVEAVINSPISVEMLRCYSKLYLDGCEPRWCALSQRAYYEELKKTGINRAKNYDMAQERTCEPKHKGTFQIRNYGFVISSQMADDQAVYLLNNKLLSEDDFTKLPDGYSAAKVGNESAKISQPVRSKKTRTKRH